MRTGLLTFAFLAALLVAPATGFAAAAQDTVQGWDLGCDGNSTPGAKITLSSGRYACYAPAASSDDEIASPLANVSSCTSVDVELHDDKNGDATVCTVPWIIQRCPPQQLLTDTIKNLACAQLLGTGTLSGDDVESNLMAPAGGVRVHGNNSGSNIEDCLLVLTCKGPE